MSIVHLNLTEYMGPADRRSHIVAYAALVDIALTDGRISGPLTSTCPECGVNFADADDARDDNNHIIVATTSDTFAVVVACEGYFVVNPNLIGIDSPNWSDADGNVPVTDDKPMVPMWPNGGGFR
jgi:hypothetical protein